MIFLGWVLLPLQAAIFSTGTTHRTRTVPMARTHRWMTLEEQSSQLDSKFLTTAYGMSWLDQKLPKWTTPDYALLPFQPLDDNTEFRSTETWSAPTTMYYTNVTCKPAINVTQLTMINWLFDDGEGCIAPELRLIFPETTETKDLMVLYIPYWKDELYFLADNMDRQLLGPNCTREANRHKFLSITAQYKPDTATFNSTQGYYDVVSAQFCQPTYHSRPVVATVNATNEAVVGVEYDATLAPNVIPEEALNITRYELLIGTGTHNTSFNREDEDLAHVHERTQIQQYEKIAKYDIGWPTSYMVPFTIAQSLSMNISADELHEPRKMVEALDRTHKLLFISAMNQLMLPIRSTDDVGVVGGTRRDRPTGVLFIREFSIVVEVSLALIAVMIVALWVHYEYRGNKLIKDPGSMLDIMRMIQTSQVLLREFDDNGTVSEDILAERIKGRRYRLTTVTRGNGPEMQLEALDAEVHQVSDGHSQKSTQIDCPEQFMAARPSELSYWTAASSFLLISAAIAVLAAFYARAVRNNGESSSGHISKLSS